MERHEDRIVKEGAKAGLLGAAAVAIWFLILDTVNGHPLFTPSVLGQQVLFRSRGPATGAVMVDAVVAYTFLHAGVFVLFGLLVTKLVHLAVDQAIFRFALMMTFVVFEIFFLGVTYIFFAESAGLFSWWSILVANTCAAAVMGYYLWHNHPSLQAAFRAAPLGA